MGKFQLTVRRWCAYVFFWTVFPLVILPIALATDVVYSARDRWDELLDDWREMSRYGR